MNDLGNFPIDNLTPGDIVWSSPALIWRFIWITCPSTPISLLGWSFMSATEWVEQILALPDTAARRRLVQQYASELDDDVAIRLKEQADRFLESEVQRSLEIAELLFLAAEQRTIPFFQRSACSPRPTLVRSGASGNIVALLNYTSGPQISTWIGAIS